jgi:hypothetical protein
MKKILAITLIPALFIGCAPINSEYPRATLHQSSTQQKMQAAEHWNVLAENEAKLITEKLPISSIIHISCVSNSSCGERSAYSTPFSEAYSQLLTTHLVNNGAMIAIDDEPNALMLEYHVQVVTHNDRGRLPHAKPGALTAGAAAAYGIYQAAENWSNPGLVAIPIVIGTDLYRYNKKETGASNSEVLVTTKIRDGNRILVSDSRVYYFNAGDANHYVKRKTNSNFMSVTDIK